MRALKIAFWSFHDFHVNLSYFKIRTFRIHRISKIYKYWTKYTFLIRFFPTHKNIDKKNISLVAHKSLEDAVTTRQDSSPHSVNILHSFHQFLCVLFLSSNEKIINGEGAIVVLNDQANSNSNYVHWELNVFSFHGLAFAIAGVNQFDFRLLWPEVQVKGKAHQKATGSVGGKSKVIALNFDVTPGETLRVPKKLVFPEKHANWMKIYWLWPKQKWKSHLKLWIFH